MLGCCVCHYWWPSYGNQYNRVDLYHIWKKSCGLFIYIFSSLMNYRQARQTGPPGLIATGDPQEHRDWDLSGSTHPQLLLLLLPLVVQVKRDRKVGRDRRHVAKGLSFSGWDIRSTRWAPVLSIFTHLWGAATVPPPGTNPSSKSVPWQVSGINRRADLRCMFSSGAPSGNPCMHGPFAVRWQWGHSGNCEARTQNLEFLTIMCRAFYLSREFASSVQTGVLHPTASL